MIKNIVPNKIEEMSRNSICPGTPKKHPGNTREKVHLLMFWIKGAGLEKNFFCKSSGEFQQRKREKKLLKNTREKPRKHPGNTRETPGKGAFTNVLS